MGRRVLIVGAGRAGCGMGLSLQSIGWEVLFVSRNRPKHCDPWVSYRDFQPDFTPDLLLIAVPDQNIGTIAMDMAAKLPETTVAGHLSGALDSSVLGNYFAGRFSAHPAFAFPPAGSLSRIPDRVIFTVEGDETGLKTADNMLDALGVRHSGIRAADKPAYHAACVIAANMTFLNGMIAASIFQDLGLTWPDELAGVLADSAVGLRPFVPQRVTGPVSRGDITVIENHLKTMERDFPAFMDYYLQGMLTLGRILADTGVIEEETWNRIKRTLNNPTRGLPPKDSSRN